MTRCVRFCHVQFGVGCRKSGFPIGQKFFVELLAWSEPRENYRNILFTLAR